MIFFVLICMLLQCKKIWYVLSKTLAEKAAWKFCDENKIDLVTVLPAFVIGPSLPPELCSTAADIVGLLKGSTYHFDELQAVANMHESILTVTNGMHRYQSFSCTIIYC